MAEYVKEIAGPAAFIISVACGIVFGRRSLDDNPGEETHKILDGMALRILKDNRIDEWGPKETSIVTYSMLAKPVKSLNNNLHLLYYLLGSGGFGAGLNIILDRLLIP